MELDDELDLDLDAGAKMLNADDDGKKRTKSKLKSKVKKTKDDSEKKSSSKSNATLPLSMTEASAEDKALFEGRLHSQKAAIQQAKEYKTTLSFKPGEVLNHKTFGIGFVVSDSGANKIEVLFAKGRKLLVTGYEK